MKGKTKQQKGITLIALIITIVVLLILAAVAINSIQNDGLIQYAKNAAETWNQVEKNEATILGGYGELINQYTPNGGIVASQLWTGEWTYGKTLDNNDGLEKSYAGSVSDHIIISPNKEYILQCIFSGRLSKALNMFYYDAEGNYISKSATIATGAVGETFKFTVPDNDEITSVRITFTASYVELATEEGLMPTETNLFVLSELIDAGFKFAGKTLLNFGDSISEAEKISYAYQIARENFMLITNRASGGATVRTSTSNYILNKITDCTVENPDFILLNGLTNDAYPDVVANELGEITADFTSTLDGSTFCGGFELMLKTVKEKWPNATFIFVTTHVNAARDYDSQNQLTELEIEMCEKWDVPVADIYHDSGMNTFDQTQFDTYIKDGSHPNELGYKTYYVPLIEAKMNELSN